MQCGSSNERGNGGFYVELGSSCGRGGMVGGLTLEEERDVGAVGRCVRDTSVFT